MHHKTCIFVLFIIVYILICLSSATKPKEIAHRIGKICCKNCLLIFWSTWRSLEHRIGFTFILFTYITFNNHVQVRFYDGTHRPYRTILKISAFRTELKFCIVWRRKIETSSNANVYVIFSNDHQLMMIG